MVTLLNGGKDVQHRRQVFAWKTLLRDALGLVLLVLVFGIMTPVAPDYEINSLNAFRRAVDRTFSASFGQVDSRAGFQSWIDANVLWIPQYNVTTGDRLPAAVGGARLLSVDRGGGMPPASSMPGPSRLVQSRGRRTTAAMADSFSTDGAAADVITFDDPLTSGAAFTPENSSVADLTAISRMAVSGNIVVGAVRVRKTSLDTTACQLPLEFSNQGVTLCKSAEPISPEPDYVQEDPPLANMKEVYASATTGEVEDLDSSDVLQRRQVADLHRTGPAAWAAEAVNTMSVHFSLFNPSFRAFASVRLFCHFADFGSSECTTTTRTSRLYHGRFQPSSIFSALLFVQLTLQGLIILFQARRKGVRKWLRSGWNVYEVVCWSLFLVVLFIDVVAQVEVNSMNVRLDRPAVFYNLWDLMGLLRTETDVISVVFYLLVIRLIKYVQLAPKLGPQLLSVILTISDGAVVLFIVVMVVLILAFSVAHHVAFGGESAYFGSVLVSFMQLFSMTTAQQFQIFSQAAARPISTIYFMGWALISLLLVNIFIGVITDVYATRARNKSLQLWEDQITELMEADMEDTFKRRMQRRLRGTGSSDDGGARWRCCWRWPWSRATATGQPSPARNSKAPGSTAPSQDQIDPGDRLLEIVRRVSLEMHSWRDPAAVAADRARIAAAGKHRLSMTRLSHGRRSIPDGRDDDDGCTSPERTPKVVSPDGNDDAEGDGTRSPHPRALGTERSIRTSSLRARGLPLRVQSVRSQDSLLRHQPQAMPAAQLQRLQSSMQALDTQLQSHAATTGAAADRLARLEESVQAMTVLLQGLATRMDAGQAGAAAPVTGTTARSGGAGSGGSMTRRSSGGDDRLRPVGSARSTASGAAASARSTGRGK